MIFRFHTCFYYFKSSKKESCTRWNEKCKTSCQNDFTDNTEFSKFSFSLNHEAFLTRSNLWWAMTQHPKLFTKQTYTGQIQVVIMYILFIMERLCNMRTFSFVHIAILLLILCCWFLFNRFACLDCRDKEICFGFRFETVVHA